MPMDSTPKSQDTNQNIIKKHQVYFKYQILFSQKYNAAILILDILRFKKKEEKEKVYWMTQTIPKMCCSKAIHECGI